MPDILKIVALSNLFSVSTDYLLKEDIPETQLDPIQKRYVSLEDAIAFLSLRRWASIRIAIASFVCILSLVPMLTLLALREEDLGLITLSEDAAGAIGISVVLVLIAMACTLFLRCGTRNKPYEFLDYESFDTQHGVAHHVRQKQREFLPVYSRCNTTGTVLCILSAVPLLLAAFAGGLGLLLAVMTIAALLEGLGQTDRKLLQMADIFRVSRGKKVCYIYFSQVLPYFITACRLSLGMCWKAGIAAEVIGVPSGSMGEKLYNAKIYLNTPDLFAWTIVIIIISVVFEKFFLEGINKLKTYVEQR